jgi:hypothetical protein
MILPYRKYVFNDTRHTFFRSLLEEHATIQSGIVAAAILQPFYVQPFILRDAVAPMEVSSRLVPSVSEVIGHRGLDDISVIMRDIWN